MMASSHLEDLETKVSSLESDDVPPFSLLGLGLNGKSVAIPVTECQPESLPYTTTLPFGLPPVIHDLPQRIDDFLNCPNQLPVHDVNKGQRKLARLANPANLYSVSLSTLQTTLQVERNATTGQLLGYKEVFIGDTCGTAKNSLSLTRQPGPLSEAIQGSTTNFPFMPGGLADEPFLDDDDDTALGVDKLKEANDIDDLLTVPPGWKEGMTFKDQKKNDKAKDEERGVSKLIEVSGELGLDDIMGTDDRFDFLEKETEEDRAKEKEKERQKETAKENAKSKDEELDKVLPEGNIKQKVDQTKEPLEEKSWAINIDVSTPVDDFHKRVPVMAHQYPFELDIFQKQAVLKLENHQSVFVAAHTSAGKTVVAEYAIALSMRHLTRTVYTSPIKALSNQKFRDFKNTFGDVGLLTGDVQIKPEASCLVMTTEILRSMLYNGSDVIRDLEWVVFDEVHYINDSERGVVWEEVLIMLPDHVNIILLSATVPNTMEFADWVGRIKRKHIYVISTLKRPVPLEHFLYTGNSNKTSNELFLLVDAKKNFLQQGYKQAVQAKKDRATKSSTGFGAKGTREGHFKSDKNVYMSVVEMLRKKEQLPIVCFTFSKKRCNDNSTQLSNLDLTTNSEKSEITVFIKKSVDRLKGSDKKLPQVVLLTELLKRGIAVHHSGILPILKEVVEMLFQRGLVKLLFATETFAMGVNMPARTVLFDSIKKHDGTNLRHLHPGEYIQMAGRAGRRGLDTTGMVIILCKGDVPETSDLHYMMKGRPTKLESQFRLTYPMILNLLRVEELRVEDMMKRSFSEFSTRKDADKHRKHIKDLQQKVKQIRDIDCYMCSDLESYYCTCKELHQLREETQKVVLSHPSGVKSLVPGRIIIIRNKRYQKNTLGVVLSSSGTSKDRKVKTLILCNPSDNDESITNETEVHMSPILKHSFWRPEGEPSHTVKDLLADDILGITTVKIKLDANKIVENFNKRQIPRFRNDPPGQSAVLATQELLRLIETNPDGLDTLDPVRDLNIRDIDLVDKFTTRDLVEKTVDKFNCTLCFNFQQHYADMCYRMKVQEDLKHYRYLLSDRSLLLLPEYHQRIQVLKELNHIDKSKTIQLKGRVACEISNHELLITELVFQNILSLYPPDEIAALLSCMVFQERRCSEPELTESLENGVKRIKEEALRIGVLQHSCGVQMPAEDFVEQYRFGLTEVVYQWAKGLEFSEITSLTDVTEGIIVRTIQRLDEVCRDVRNAARIVGDPILFSKMEEASQLIKRDIVFTASLYTQ
ncbi:helicase SKI2W-like [Lytechinus variegatus]|uniref:helicase SKI2W-like n=1 Tax=Lytechinus variegatus TaxID=7654 RepID=UPI001BB28F6D|nr:helicase SKI2W-like [Lytechinus variegatus]